VTRGGDQELGITSRAGSREREQEVRGPYAPPKKRKRSFIE